jgi:hypothetical protein
LLKSAGQCIPPSVNQQYEVAKTAAVATNLEAIPNIGLVVTRYLRQLGIHIPADLKTRNLCALPATARADRRHA